MKRARESADGFEGPRMVSTASKCSSYVQILGTETGDTCPTILLVTESARYLFNAGDGLQVFRCAPLVPYLFLVRES